MKLKKKLVWRIAIAVLLSILIIGLGIEGSYWSKRRAGKLIDGTVEVNGQAIEDARVYRNSPDAHIVLFDGDDYFLRGNDVGHGAGPFWGEYFGSIYTKADGIYAEFPPSVKTEPWDPKPRVVKNREGKLVSFEFTSIDSRNVKVKFDE